mgnify:CR=1 FL=1
MGYVGWQGWGSTPVIAYPIEAIDRLEKELNEFRQGIIKSINEFINSPPAEFVYVVENKDYIELESNARGAAINIQPVIVMTQPPRLISPSIVINEVITQLGALGFSNYGFDDYGNTVYKKTMHFWDNANEFINWLYNSNIRISDEVKDAVNKYGGYIEFARWVKEVLVRSKDVENEVIYVDKVILRIKRRNNGLLNRLVKLLKPRR